MPVLVGEQSTLNEEVNECCLCGLSLGSIVLAPGEAQTLTIHVDDAVCTNGVLFSMAGMLGEVTTQNFVAPSGSGGHRPALIS